jgi:hypothetical protein
MPVLIVDALEVIDVDHETHDRMFGALGARQLLAQPRLQITPVMKAGQEVREATAHEPRAVDGILDANGGDHTEMREEIAGEICREAARVGAEEYQHAVELLLAVERDDGEAAAARDTGQEQLVIGEPERSEPGSLEVRRLGCRGRQHIDEVDSFELLERQPAAREQMADLVLRIVQRQRDGIELVGFTQAADQAIEELCDRAGPQQLELPLLSLAQQRVVAAHLLGQLFEPRAQPLDFFRHTGPTPGAP